MHAGTIDINKVDFPHFTSVRFVNDKKEGIAKTQRFTGELVLNLFYWNQLKPEHQFYILAHEEGHIFYKTEDELKADEHANEKYMQAGLPVTESVHALSDHLDRNNPVHIARAWQQYQRGLQYDWEHNHNNKSYRNHYQTVEEIKSVLHDSNFIKSAKDNLRKEGFFK
jgi:hypothetical protein